MGGFVPLGDASRPPGRIPPVTLLLIAVNAIVFFQELTDGAPFVDAWSAIPIQIVHGNHIITLITSMFMHASWMHIIGNMIYLWAFGREIENAMGSFRFAIFYLIGGIVAMSAQILGDPFSYIHCLGASGAIAAVMGAFIITFPRDRIKTLIFLVPFFRITLVPAMLLIGFWFVIQVLNVGSVADVRTGGVAYLAHIAGFLFGVVTAKLFVNPRRMTYRRFS